MASLIFLILTVCLLSAILSGVRPAAIPMWEYLRRDEKILYLTAAFVDQVDQYCNKDRHHKIVVDCEKTLKTYGLAKLNNYSNDDLDLMDPNQRNADLIIWGSMMTGHDVMKHPYVSVMSKSDSSNVDYMVPSVLYADSSEDNWSQSLQRHLDGPMVVKVYPDGRPVIDGAHYYDNDLRQYEITKMPLRSHTRHTF